MSNVNYHLLNNSVIISFDGQRIILNKEDHRFNKVVNCIKNDKLGDIPDIVNNDNLFNKLGLELRGEQLFFDGEQLPKGLSDRVINFSKNDLPFEYLVKFFKKLKGNPSFNSRKMLYKFLEHNGHPITQDGNFIAYRGVNKEFKDCHTNTFDNSVGSICEMDRNEVDDNPNNTCSRGLHVACYDYANGFGDNLVEVEVNPADVVAVPTDYNNTKMRVSKFKVVNICKGELKEELYGEENDDKILEVGQVCFMDTNQYFNDFGIESNEEVEVVEYIEELDMYDVRDEYGDTVMVDRLDLRLVM